MNPRLYLLNGQADSIATTTGMLERHLWDDAYDVQHLYRPTVAWWQSKSKQYLRRTARHLIYQMDLTAPGYLIAHSQGCLQAYWMMRIAKMRLWHRIVFVAPAMDRQGWAWDWCDFDRLLTIYNPNDLAIWAGALLPFHPYGFAGVRGFRTKDPRIINREDSSLSDGWIAHSHYFHDETARQTADLADLFFQAQAGL